MSATGKIDFEPGLFDESQPEAAPDLPAIQGSIEKTGNKAR